MNLEQLILTKDNASVQKSYVNRFDKNTFINLFVFKNANEGFNHSFDLELAGEKFNPAMGFNAETDYGFISLSNGKNTKLKDKHAVNYWNVNTELDYRWKLQSQLTETKFANLQTSGLLYKQQR